jgi:hypothetical protein
MDEKQWLTTRRISRLLRHVERDAPGRKLRLFGCAWARRFWRELSAQGRKAIEASERYADGQATARALAASRAAAYRAMQACTTGAEGPAYATMAASDIDWNVAIHMLWPRGRTSTKVRSEQLALFRDIFSNPFRRCPISPAILTPDVVTLAHAAYHDRLKPSGQLDPARLAVLSDALEEAGAASELLEHLRAPGPHVRGCWVVDVVLGKK